MKDTRKLDVRVYIYVVIPGKPEICFVEYLTVLQSANVKMVLDNFEIEPKHFMRYGLPYFSVKFAKK